MSLRRLDKAVRRRGRRVFFWRIYGSSLSMGAIAVVSAGLLLFLLLSRQEVLQFLHREEFRQIFDYLESGRRRWTRDDLILAACALLTLWAVMFGLLAVVSAKDAVRDERQFQSLAEARRVESAARNTRLADDI